MHNALQILNISFGAVLGLLVIATARVGFSGYASTFGGRQFGYRFDKTRLPRWGYAVLAVMGACFVYALIITHQVGEAIGFCILLLPFSALGCLLSVCYVPRNSKNKSTAKSSRKGKDSSWLV